MEVWVAEDRVRLARRKQCCTVDAGLVWELGGVGDGVWRFVCAAEGAEKKPQSRWVVRAWTKVEQALVGLTSRTKPFWNKPVELVAVADS